MKKALSAFALTIALVFAASLQPASACNGTVHLPGCGASGNFC
jgi:hypothetical protein